jgi:hypothetical protein
MDPQDQAQAGNEAPKAEANATAQTDAPAPEKTTRDADGLAGADDYFAQRDAALAPVTDQADPEPDSEPEAETAPDPEPDPEPEAETAKPRDFRPRLGALPDLEKEAIALRKQLMDSGQDVPLVECIRRTESKYSVETEKPPTQAADAEQQGATTEPPTGTIEDLLAQLQEAKTARRAAIKDIDADAQLEAEDRIDALSVQIEASRAEASRAEQQSMTAFEQELQSSRARVYAEYPEAAADPSHAIHDEARKIFRILEKTGNPKYHEADAPHWVYQRAANNLGILPADSEETVTRPNGSNKPQSSAPAKPRPVQQHAVTGRPQAKPALAPGGARTTANGQPTGEVDLQRIHTRHDYEATLEKLGVNAA